MQQISLPFRIALGAILAFGVVWFAVLRPKDTTTEPATPAPGVAGLTNSTNAAKSAVEKANASSAARQSAADAVDASTSQAPATGASTAKPAGKADKKAADPDSLESYVGAAGPATSLVKWLADGKVVVFVFRNDSADSGAAVRAARKVAADRKKLIRLRVTRIGNVGKYAIFTDKTPIGQAPSTLIIGPHKRARVITGYTTTGEISEAVADVRGKR